MNLKEIRKTQGFSQKSLAEKLGVSATNIYNYEIGRTEPSLEMLCKIADVLSVTLDFLIGRSDDFGAVNVTVAGEDLSQEEKELVRSYRALDFDARNVIRIQLKALVESKV